MNVPSALRFGGLLCLALIAAPLPAADGELPPDNAYCTVRDGHLAIAGEPVRFWAAIGSFPGKRETIDGDPYYRQRQAVRRAKVVGFNMFRIWHMTYDDAAEKGDLSGTDVSDFFVAECARQGVRLWAAGFGGGRLYADDLPEVAGLAGDGEEADEWVAAVRGMCRKHYWSKGRPAVSLKTPAVAWDPRLEAAAIAQMKQKAHHVNLHTGLRHADDPTFVVWELVNEQWWMSHMTGGDWRKLPALLRRSLLRRWNAWLTDKYKTQDALAKAWGFLFPGEDLGRGTILLAPLRRATEAAELNDTNPAAVAVFRKIANPIGRDDCTVARGNDVIAFFLDVLLAHKRRWAAELKSWGKSCRLSPLLYDTGIGQNIQSQYLHLQADATSHCSYMEGLELDKLPRSHKRWPFYSGLDAPPQMCKDVPWLEHNRATDKPFLCYETQFGSPSKYRAEWPVRIAALASIQDWSAACYHYWTFNKYDFTSETPYSVGPLSKPGPGAFQYDYTTDELEQATMRAAGALFRHHLLRPAPEPTVFSWGRPALLDPRSMDYAGDYGRTGLMDMMATTYTRGMRIVIDPTQESFGEVDGPVTRFNGFERPCPLSASPDIAFDYQRGHVVMDAPGAAAYTGFLGQYGAEAVAFDNGVTLGNVTHADPPQTPYPAGEERFTSFTLASEDGKPLGECRRAVLALVASSFNTGLKIERQGGKWKVDYGRTPVLVTRVGGTVTAKSLAEMRWRMIDFNERVLAEGTVGADGVLSVPADKPVWLTELWRE